jgi:threonine dehydrogenase-like Zn-dependent dehydrogenase
MSDKLSDYIRADAPLPKQYKLWPLYGAGLENLGVDKKPIDVNFIACGPDELVVRHDAVGLCFSDTKVINQGENHPRVQRDMKAKPVTLGHEVSMTVVQVGANLKNQYKVGDRLAIEADVYVNGKSLAYGYHFQGGLSQYAIIDARVMHSDTGNMLIPLKDEMGYAESALAEPWACVIAAYRLEYRTSIKPGGILWIIGAGEDRPYSLSAGFTADSHPARLLLTNVPAKFASWLRAEAAKLGVEVLDVADATQPGAEFSGDNLIDDIVILGADPKLVETVSPFLAQFGVLAVVSDQPMPRKVSIDVGRVHYHRWAYVGTPDTDVACAYNSAIQSNLKPGGSVWFVGAGGPIGRMHVQRAIEFSNPPSVIVCSDVSDMRLDDLCNTFSGEANQKGIEFICLNPTRKEEYAAGMARFFAKGFDYITVLAPVAPVIADAASHIAPNGTVNVFAGVPRGTMVDLDLDNFYRKGVRIIGHSGSDMSDMLITIKKTEINELLPNRSVAAIGSLSAAHDGIRAVKETTFPGKVVIYPNIKEFPLTAIQDLKDVLPTVYAKMKNGREWTNEAEQEFLRLMLP